MVLCGFYVAVALTAALPMAMNQADPDLWGHVQFGRELLRDGTLPRTATWTFTAAGHRWINHEILSELAMAWSVEQFGPAGLLWGKFGLSLILIGLIMAAAIRRGVHPVLTALAVLLVAVNVEAHWHFRPQIAGYTLFAVLIAWIDAVFANAPVDVSQVWRSARARWGRLRSQPVADDQAPTSLPTSPRGTWTLWLSPLLFCLWANSHGSFVAGLAVFIAYLATRSVGLLLIHGWKAVPGVLQLAGIALASAAGTLANPYGVDLHAWLFSALHIPRPEIQDWESVSLLSDEAAGLRLLMLIGAVGLWQTRRKRDVAELAVLAVVLWQAVSHIRHLPFLAMLFGFWIPVHLNSWLMPAGQALGARYRERPRARSVAVAGLAAWMGLVAISLGPQLTRLKVDRSRFPVAAMQYMREAGLYGNVLVTFNWAQYAIGCFARQAEETAGAHRSQVAVDGRFRTCYPQEVIDIYFDFLFGADSTHPRHRSTLSGPVDPARALSWSEPDLLIVSRRQRPPLRTIHAHANNWVLVYQDELSQIWGRKDRYGDSASPHYLPPTSRRVCDVVQSGWAAWPATSSAGPARDLAKNRPVGASFGEAAATSRSSSESVWK
ncbi:hypothetical protein Mal4_00990 [Maioricimonas rarisocia]|uniref:Glycosyltransferase RgtA/B/C/D-like domain-containing protein n=1 Tax=Maioricimonas rarisocia TaxID=2528026 RepID=A0A517Z006_9PLAN|nr:hypothetical protein [Maioricimonas rarisocia]QDU35817.1 hypothetical protein Mal4_00990 [Maioricimonas rarisocia]